MLMSLFSVFDPISYSFLGLNWFMVVIVGLFVSLTLCYWCNNGLWVVVSFVVNKLVKLFKDMVGGNNVGLACMGVVVFCVFMIMNVFSLFPFIFSVTAHPVITMGSGVTLWISFFVMGWWTNGKNMAMHLVPCGCPLMLAPFMVFIESISIMIRPFTLSIRLAANMMAGHLIVGLLSSISQYTMMGFVMSVLFQNVMMLLEVGVAIIQSFVFSALILLYVVESY